MMYINKQNEIDMKVVADVSERGEIPEYLTDGKEYLVTFDFKEGEQVSSLNWGFYIYDDEGVQIYCKLNWCEHLNNGRWRIVGNNEKFCRDRTAHLCE